jgi:hypothetical protein
MDVGAPERAGPVLTVRATAFELSCSISFVYKLMAAGELAFERRGRRKLPLASSVAEYRQRSFVPPRRPAASSVAVAGHRRYRHLFNEREPRQH